MTDPFSATLTVDVIERLAVPDAVALARRTTSGWLDVTIGEFHDQVVRLTKGLLAAGVQPGDRVVLASRTRYEWTVADYAIWWAGAVSVPVYDSSTPEQVAHVVADCAAVAAICESVRLSEAMRSAGVSQVWTIDSGGFAALEDAGTSVTDAEIEARRSATVASDPATIVYTSGTTTAPKGCVLSHGNLRAALSGALARLPELFDRPDSSTLLVLPLPHVFSRIVQIGAIRAGVRLAHSGDVRQMADDFASFRPTFVLAVPRVFERVLNDASTQAYADGHGAVFDRGVSAAIAFSQAQEHGRPGVLLRARHKVFDKVVYSRIREAFGGQAEWAVCGGAPLGDRLVHFLRGAGIGVLEGYGLTETSGAVTANAPGSVRIGSVGQALPGVDLRTAPDGELQVRGAQVFDGYWAEPGGQALAPDGWFSTGDLAEIDADGFVRIVGRKREILVTAGGKAIAPAALEDRIRAHPVVSNCIVVGDGKPFAAALVTIDAGAWAGRLDDPDLLAQVQSAIDEANREVSPAEAVRRFAIADQDWTEQNGYLTPSFKVKRYAVLRDFHDQIETLFVR